MSLEQVWKELLDDLKLIRTENNHSKENIGLISLKSKWSEASKEWTGLFYKKA